MKFLIILTLAVAASAFPESKLVLEGRITGGQKASVGQFPYQVGLEIWDDETTASWCGGSLISPTWILTAAHCAENFSSITAHFGATIRTSAEVTRTVSKAILHPNWVPRTMRNDIALLNIPAVTLSNKIKLAKLPALTRPLPDYVGLSAIISGWGLDSDNAPDVTTDLLYASVGIVNNNICRNFYGSSRITNFNLCIDTPLKISPCYGDSGGPMVLSSNNEQVGVISYGSDAGCELNHPGVLTRVDRFRPWIQEITGI